MIEFRQDSTISIPLQGEIIHIWKDMQYHLAKNCKDLFLQIEITTF